MSNPYIFNPKAAREFSVFSEIIVSVFQEFEDVTWSSRRSEELGFYFKDNPNKVKYFFGVWYDLWEYYGTPLSLVIDYWGKAPIQWHERLKLYLENTVGEHVQIVNYDGFTCLLFNYEYFEFEKNTHIDRLISLFETDFIEIIEKMKK